MINANPYQVMVVVEVHAALIANFNNSTDTNIYSSNQCLYSIYTRLLRTTDTKYWWYLWNLCIKFSRWFNLNHVYLDVHVNGINGKANNGGAIWGQGRVMLN